MTVQSMRNKPTAFVLNMDSNGLGVTRSLGREHVPVVGVDFRTSAPGLRSRYCRPLIVADPSIHPEQVLQRLIGEGRALSRKGILYPTSDAFVLFVSRYRKQLSEFFRLAVPSESILEGILNKRCQYEAAQRVGIPIADTFYPGNINEVEEIGESLHYPAFIKPYYSHLWQAKFENKGFRIQDSGELLTAFRKVFDAGLEAMVQSVIIGPNTNHVKVCGYFDESSKPLALFVTQKIRQFPTDFGVGTLMQGIHNQEVQDLGMKFFRGIGYQGAGSIEFKKDDRDGTYKMIELNARLWQQNIQATFAGVNFPLIQYLHLTGESGAPVLDFKDGVRWFDALQDFQAFRKYWKDGSLGPVQWLKSWLGSECYAYFAWDDLKPGWVNSEYGLKYLRLPLHMLKNR